MVRKKLTTEEFITKSRLKHRDKYDYSEVVYLSTHEKVKIFCSKHGIFEQRPSSHLRGFCCPKCASENLSITLRSKSSEFIEKAKGIHGNKYDYDEVVYTQSHVKVKIICTEHGIFEQTPSNHLKGFGCSFCSGKTPYTFETLDKAVDEKHNGEIFLVDGQEIKGIKNKYRFKHSCGHEWYAKASHMLSGKGCPKCAATGFKADKPATFYILSINGDSEFTGFGISNVYKKRRTRHLRNLKANNCSIISEILIQSDGLTIQKLEQHVKQELSCKNSRIEGFRTESVLIPSEELLDFCIKWLTEQKAIYKIESKSG